MQKKRILCIGGPSAAGKDMVATQLVVRRPMFVRVPRVTTRPPRIGEVDGVDYRFLQSDEFTARENVGDICAVDHYCGHRYGIDVASIQRVLREGHNVVGVFGICSTALRRLFNGGTCLVYVTADVQVLRRRLEGRGDHSPQEVDARIRAALHQLQAEPSSFDHVLNNNCDPEQVVDELIKIVDREIGA